MQSLLWQRWTRFSTFSKRLLKIISLYSNVFWSAITTQKHDWQNKNYDLRSVFLLYLICIKTSKVETHHQYFSIFKLGLARMVWISHRVNIKLIEKTLNCKYRHGIQISVVSNEWYKNTNPIQRGNQSLYDEEFKKKVRIW